MATALLQGCGGSVPPVGAPGAMPQAPALAVRSSSSNYTVLHSFGAPPDGGYPRASLIDVGGTLYGTTTSGGTPCGSTYSGPYTCGTVFSITTSGAEKVLHSFGSGSDGRYPEAGLIDVRGTLYGTTPDGGANRCGYTSVGYPFACGTVFSIPTSGTEKVLHSFGVGKDGVAPVAALIEAKGTLYGTTSEGGERQDCSSTSKYDQGCGTVFSITPSGTENVLHRFSPRRHAYFPRASLIYAGGSFYGTTKAGGKYNAGTVFRMTVGGKFRVLHSFGNGTDGQLPVAGLIEVKGTFYGTTFKGGAHTYGTVFSITPGGKEKVLYSFALSTGAGPEASLVDVNGTLYGTTCCGGTVSEGEGTLFSISTSGTETVLHSFGNTGDGKYPEAGLIDVNGTLYGTTNEGGGYCAPYGCGTVFAFTP